MPLSRLGAPALPVSAESRYRFRFTVLTVVVTVALMAWGGLVTSIDAGLAVPDWPTSFGSMDPFATGYEDPSDPSARWWHHLPILAEHGHRLLGALVGLLTLILAGWTWFRDDRRWMRRLGLGVLALVIFQGILGGLRVTEVSLTLAMVHACTAQIFFALLVAMALFTSAAWRHGGGSVPATAGGRRLRHRALATAIAIYLQIVLGALLRHFGTGIDPFFAGIHIGGAVAVVGLIGMTVYLVRRHAGGAPLVRRAGAVLLGTVGVQFALGLMAFAVLLFETQAGRRSLVQIVLNSAHLIVGAVLLAAAVCLVLLSRRPAPARPPVSPAVGTPALASTAS
ncbi:MAG: COX15/CtaA family protein [Rhodothermales bacterium]|nr:COX15/CtaA family protein [Rhodothermales bacterium]